MKDTFTRAEVIELLKQQRSSTAYSLGFSSAVYMYPVDFEKMREWMENSGLVLQEIAEVKYPQCPFSQIIVQAPTMHIKTCDICVKQGYPIVDIKIVDGKVV